MIENKCRNKYNHNIYYYFILLFCFAFIVGHAAYYLPFIADDALISLQYAKRFLAGKGLTWTDGIPVEGYSNFLWIILISFLGLFKIDLIISVRVLGVIFFFITFFYLIKNAIEEQNNKYIAI
ncbi:MAG: hypothetical protein N2114_06915, partial [Candidatus Goldbacteria bacterium]|nr:hypothetical protein [Candidatus Goldiibacteriota bacterium]